MIDFGALVLGPAMATFAQPITVTPQQPGAVRYPARGSYSSRPVEIQISDGNVQRSHEIKLGIRLSEFPALPAQGDVITMTQGSFVIYDVMIDGQGGADLSIRQTDRVG